MLTSLLTALLCVWSTTVEGLTLPDTTPGPAVIVERRDTNSSDSEDVALSGAQAVQFGPLGRAVGQPAGDQEPPHYCPHIQQGGFQPRGGVEMPAVPNKEELIYLMPTLVGGQQLQLLVDTGSADLYVNDRQPYERAFTDGAQLRPRTPGRGLEETRTHRVHQSQLHPNSWVEIRSGVHQR